MLIRRLQPPRIDFGALRQELALPADFPPEVREEARAAASRAPTGYADCTDLPFVTVDPPGSRDLDQALCLETRADGSFLVRYAIADVAFFVDPDGAVAAESWRRGQTVYLPDGNTPLHPVALSEGAASLLPDVTRPAVVWTMAVDAAGAVTDFQLARALVRSRARYDYAGVQAAADAGTLPAPLRPLPALGRALVDAARGRGAISLPTPEQELVADRDTWRLTLRGALPVEEYNAQVSLLTGAVAAQIMLTGGVGLLRTMPAPPAAAVRRLRTAAAALRIDWPDGAGVGAVVAAADPARPRGAAFLDHAAELLRGAGYTAFDGAVPPEVGHAGVGSAYAHVTAPLRRLADRFATEVCLALSAGAPVPEWARAALPRLPAVMGETGRRTGAAERAAVDLAEATVLRPRVGELFEATVVDVDEPGGGAAGGRGAPREPGGVVALADPVVRARCRGALPLGEQTSVRLVTADPDRREVLFAAE
ncbi:ribonuclease R [Pilimelia terevasa]|uniref:Ribonuclease R n=1 Tax=Pilimelia terevasa TaxID=53372 RepID=A0A8J3BQY5_9ACTN|nr:RNB domain-containing ribonuclease [Pilimelia terevasa]GGK27002.1 ribonuclease R [Pilimelia terevasa]